MTTHENTTSRPLRCWLGLHHWRRTLTIPTYTSRRHPARICRDCGREQQL